MGTEEGSVHEYKTPRLRTRPSTGSIVNICRSNNFIKISKHVGQLYACTPAQSYGAGPLLACVGKFSQGPAGVFFCLKLQISCKAHRRQVRGHDVPFLNWRS